jgi:hypothetical protein
MKFDISLFVVPLFVSLLGFYTGNILPTLLVLIQPFFPWVHGLAFVVILWNECLGMFLFKFPRLFSFPQQLLRKKDVNLRIPLNQQSPPLQQLKKKLKKFRFSQLKTKGSSIIFSLRSFHFGFLFGLFVDAFKVGS